ncbi:Fmu (Sun) domain protein [Gluconacetobacter diazotrophicus PA1 5]|uniref:RsmB/NOP family class I SAM-dependent RNA methyltransferase n=2 Tax=Gluconacetobacter diazotrophicus TaxID=33996 RepID=A0A7W4FDL3_GLUDI|nr:RsmB/NOP family class I SAM-dependent RNA methyltransferase [Gluconacetobacter diazotrophicus]ACI49843.1 Fmu (Sun) domain protein [Gluconacetobacter diazotrophicus PA1 5]MBB2155831.1 RsmB/NOP family class I SAM-dependent RNA methyltransferase [Gluconacetobacter diazotrophicus]TWB10308.1 16S rRNA (cytosine967-C5)-methyltransferase [Gluconacetobacter diazotrophicus]
MTPSARLAAAIDLLSAMEATPRRPADAVANAFFRERRYIGGGDRRAISARVWTVLRHWRHLAWWLDRAGAAATPRARLIAALALMPQPGEAPQDLFVSQDRYAPQPLSAAERDLATRLRGQAMVHPDMPRAVRLEVPDWLLPRLEETFGADLDAEVAALAGEATLDLRVNLLKTTRAEAARLLAADGIMAEPTGLSPWGLRVPGRQPVTATAAFKSGLVEIQDEGSQIVVAAADARPGMRVLDYCAGAAGKTLGMAMTMENRGHIVACDVSEPRLEGAVRRLRRAGVHNAERHLLVPGDRWARRRAASFDRVLVDAPCTGTGTWRRNPDARLRLTEQDLAELMAKQADILATASALVRPGGRLVYATCSILREENQDRIASFLRASPHFRRAETVPDLAPDLAQDGMIALSPLRHGTDGFFAAILERTA